MFGLILLSAVTILHLYVVWRVSSLPFLRGKVTGRMLAASALFLWLLFLLGRIYGHDATGAVAMSLELSGLIWMVVLFLIAVPMLGVDVFTLFGNFMPAAALRLRGAACTIGLLLSMIALVQGTRQPVVRNYEVLLAALPHKLDNTVIVGLSDLHLGSLRDGDWLKAIVSRVQAEKPDMIVLLGDVFEGHGKPSEELAAELAGLKAPLGVWAVLGNHEFHGRDNGIVPVFKDAGVAVLRNERVMVRPGLELAGVDDLTSNHRSGAGLDLVTRALAPQSPGATILLSHTPWNADRAARSGADLMLSGHTHGGQIWPFGYLVKIIYPLLAGRYDVDGMAVIVSRGAGLWGPPMRLWQPGEILRVTLREKNTAAVAAHSKL